MPEELLHVHALRLVLLEVDEHLAHGLGLDLVVDEQVLAHGSKDKQSDEAGPDMQLYTAILSVDCHVAYCNIKC